MKLSYLVTCSSEITTLRKLLDRLTASVEEGDEIIVIADTDVSDRQSTTDILKEFVEKGRVQWFDHSLNRNYGAHKDWGARKCTGDWIFQIDGDECPTEILLLNVKDIIEANPDIELIYVPRINDYKGVTDIHAKQWGWKLTPYDQIIHEKVIDTDSHEYQFLKKNGYILEESVV